MQLQGIAPAGVVAAINAWVEPASSTVDRAGALRIETARRGAGATRPGIGFGATSRHK
jgi:hypothetical protein